jgi:hypothetical protein
VAEGRPVLHALVGFFSPVFGLCNTPRMMPLEDAVEYQRLGFVVFVDPQDESDLARWEQIQRAYVQQPRRSWLND